MKKWISIFSSLFLSLAGLLVAQERQRMVVIGGGVGGLTAGVYAGRAGFEPLIIEGPQPGGAMVQSHSVQNWPGEIDISGWDLMEKLHKQAELSGSKFLQDQVVSVDFSKRPFTILTRSLLDPSKEETILADSCVIALGATPNFLHVPGEKEYWLKGVYSCAVCDGPLYKGKTVAVVGGGDAAIVEAHFLSQIAKKVYLIVRRNEFRGSEDQRRREVLARDNVEVIYQATVDEIKGDSEALSTLVIKDLKKNKLHQLPVDALFLGIGSKPNSELFAGQLELDKNGFIVLKTDTQTSVPGVFAIGDVADPIYRQAVSAAAGGMKAVHEAEKYLGLLSSPEHALALSLTSATQLPRRTSAQSNASHGAIIEIQNEEQFEREIKQGQPVLIDFYASWCGPCRAIAPLFEKNSVFFEGRIKFLKVNVDQLHGLSSRFKVSAMPTMVILDRRGNIITRKVGSQEISQYFQKMTQIQTVHSADALDEFILKT